MEARKPKYSLFPAPPTSKPFSSVRDPPPAPENALPPDSTDPTSPQERSPPPPAEPLPPESQDPPTSPKPSYLSHEVAPVPQEQQEQRLQEPDSPVFPRGMTASSFSTASHSSESSLKPTSLSLASPTQQVRKRPKRAFVRHGLGGAGNYHKRPDSSPNSDYSGFLASLLSTFSHKKRKTRQYSEGDSTGCSQYSNQALPLGAAEVLKRKMLGQASGGKRSTSSDRS